VRFAHQRGIIHGGIRPTSILYDEDAGCPVVTDFDSADALTLDTTTATYAAPEQRQGGQERLVESDIYSLGRLLQYLITEQTPELGKQLRVGDELLARIIVTCTREQPAQRYGDIDELQSDVRRWRTGQGVTAARQSTHPPTQIPPQLLPALTVQNHEATASWGKLVAWCAVLGLCAGSIGFVWQKRSELGWGSAAVMPAPPDAGPPPAPAKKQSKKPKRARVPNAEQSDLGPAIPSEAIGRLFRDNSAAFQRCHSNVELPVTDLTGRVTTRFKVDADGVISEARVVETSVKAAAVAKCVAAAHNGLRLSMKPGLPTYASSRYDIGTD
jgi:serine/threonine protein kinase